MKAKYYSLALLFILFGCRKKESPSIDSYDQTIKADVALSDLIEVKEDYILLDTIEGANIILPQKVLKSPDGTIWINDSRGKKFVNFTTSGKWIGTFSKFGQGPGEYINQTDFDITPTGQIYVLDGRLDKVFVYEASGEFSHYVEMPFEASMMHVLNDGNILFGISAWDKTYGNQWKVALTDSEGSPIEFMIPADEFVDNDIWLGISGFTVKENGDIIYNREINDDIYVFDSKGKIKSVTHMDFGKYTVADEDKKNIENNSNFDNYRNIVGRVGMFDDNFIGNIWVNGRMSMFVTDGKEAKIQLIDRHLGNIGFINDCMVQPILVDEEDYQLPDSVRQHLENEGMALRILKF